MRLSDLTQERLALFITDRDSGAPQRKVPVYAEIVCEPRPSLPPIDCPILGRIRNDDPLLADEIVRQLAAVADEDWLLDNACDAVDPVAERAYPYVGRGVDQEVRDVIAEAVREMAAERDVPAPTATPDLTTRRIPLGVLGTDHAGYVSFDLARLRLDDLRRVRSGDADIEILAYPMLLEANVVRVLEQRRVAPDAVVGRVTLLNADNPMQEFALNLPAMQNPGIIDWRLSPGSFAAVPQSLIGADGCEMLTPANFAVSTFHLRQVIRLNEKVAGTEHPAALVNEFAVSFIPIGHALGEIKYSLPLAPGESVRLAVIDWRRADAGSREEATGVSEALVHEQTHDRLVTESMQAALEEWQRGGSVMGGTAGGAGAAGSWGPFSVAGGSMTSIGGGYSTSSGSRDLTAETQQKVADSVAQATSSVRELHSSVVVQTTQQESESIETRAFANFNRGHTLTVLYYEVLRHFRLVSEFTTQYRAVLLPRLPWNLLDDVLLLDKRYVLQGALLDPALAPAFDALARADRVRAERKRNPPVSVAPPNEADIVFSSFSMAFAIGGENSSNAFSMSVIKHNGERVTLLTSGSPNLNRDSPFDNEDSEFLIVSDPAPGIRWGDIKEFRFRKDSDAWDDAVRVIKIDITGNSSAGPRSLHPHIMGMTYYLNNEGEEAPLGAAGPPPAPPAPPIPSFEQTINADDYALIERLKAHLTRETEYYARVLDLSHDPNAYARAFEKTPFGGQQQIDAVSPKPLEFFGSNIAFPLLDQEDLEQPVIAPTERLVSLPTRGLFAEAKLGHCSVAEEIDETRFWRWDEHPLPFQASDIAPVVPVQPQSQPVALAPTALPSPVATVQAPSALPDPTGLAAILSAITKPDIFRDMSMSEEVGKLLSDLIEGSVSMAQAAAKAGDLKKKLDDSSKPGATETAARAVEAQAGAQRAQSEQQKAKDQQVTPAEAQHAIKVAENQSTKGLITPEEAKEVAKTQVQNMKGSTAVAKPKTRERTLEVVIRGYGGTNIIGQWAWELWQKGESKGFRPLERHDDGRIVMKTVSTDDDSRFRLDLHGEVLAGYGVNSKINARNLDFEIPQAVWDKRDYIYVTLNAVVGQYKVTAKNGSEAVKKFTDNIGGEIGGEFIVELKLQGGGTWEKSDTVNRAVETEVTVEYYKGGLEITKIS